MKRPDFLNSVNLMMSTHGAKFVSEEVDGKDAVMGGGQGGDLVWGGGSRLSDGSSAIAATFQRQISRLQTHFETEPRDFYKKTCFRIRWRT